MTGPIMGGIAGDPFESNQDLGELNLMTLIGCTDERGDAWHRRDDLMGDESNHYPGFIPESDVNRRLLDWRPQRADVAYLLPYSFPRNDAGEIQWEDRDDVVTLGGTMFRVVRSQENRIGVLRDDNDYDMGVFKSGATHPPYQVTLIERAQRITGATLGISTAGLLQKGGLAWMEFSMRNAMRDEKSGLEYRPNLLIADSMNGSISLTTALTIEATVCMNTLTRNLREAKSTGNVHRRKHTRSIATSNLEDEREALGILEVIDHEFLAELHDMIDTPITEKQRIEVMDILAPVDLEAGKRSQTLANDKRDMLVSLDTNPMVAPWVGTVYGEYQRYNTADHWFSSPRGTGQWECNTWRIINNERAKYDRNVVGAIEKVLSLA